MMSLSCKDMGMMDCDFVAQGATEEEVMQNSTAHGKSVHADKMAEMMKTMSEADMTAMMKSKIKSM